MAEKFEIGEVALLVGSHFHPEYIGRECVVKSARYQHRFANGVKAGAYVCELEGHGEFHTDERHLRKKRPPPREIDRVVSWDDCLWKPQGVTCG